jgi:dienelactone hydrolase
MATAKLARLTTVVVLALVVVACGSANQAVAPPATTSTDETTPTHETMSTPPAVPAACGDEQTMWLPDPTGGRLSASSTGSGPVAAVFLHEIGHAGRCGFWPYAQWLAARDHVQAVLVDRCGNGESTCAPGPQGDAGISSETKPAIDWATSHGATRVVLVGASGGGGDALEAAAILPVDALVDISGDGNDTGADDSADAARDRVPSLFAVAPGDPYVSVPDVAALFAKVPVAAKRCEVVTTQPAVHGWDLLADAAGDATPFGQEVAEWIQGRYARSAACRT